MLLLAQSRGLPAQNFQNVCYDIMMMMLAMMRMMLVMTWTYHLNGLLRKRGVDYHSTTLCADTYI